MSRCHRWPLVVILAAVPLSVAPAGADWLVLQDGSRVETRGPWEERGATMVFHLPNGTLGSVRTRDVDREATAAANAPRPPRSAPETPAPRKPTLVLTDADVGHVDAAQLAAEKAAAAPAPAAATQPATTGTAKSGPAPPPERLEVTTWRPDAESTTAVTLVGEVRNTSQAVTAGVRVTAFLYDEKGALIATSDAMLGADVLQPGQSTNFRASFPGVATYSSVKFETKNYAMKVAAPPAQ